MKELKKDMYWVIRDHLDLKGYPVMVDCIHDKTRWKARDNWGTSIRNTRVYGVNTYEKS